MKNMTTIHAGVNYKESPDFEFETDIKPEQVGIIIFKSPAEIIDDGKVVRIEPGTAVIWKEKQHMHYRAAEGRAFIHDFAYFEYNNSNVNGFFDVFPSKTPIELFYADEISHTLELIVSEAFLKRDQVDKIISHLNHVFWNRIKREVFLQENVRKKGVHYQSLYELRDRIYASPEYNWSVDKMCEIVHLSESYFQHRYKEYFGVSCMSDVIKARMKAAKRLLTHSDTKISIIAEKCGYKNVEHFTRQFKSNMGISPGEYRGRE